MDDDTKVKELNLHGKKLRTLQDLSKLKALKVLDVSCNRISKIEGLNENKELCELKLYGNSISIIEGLDKLTKLSTLLLHSNKIASIGRGLCHSHKLCYLRLDHNYLTSVSSGELAPCGTALAYLDLSYNHLQTLNGLGSLTNLTELNLAENCLTAMPNLSNCKKLAELNMSGNPLEATSLLQLKCLQLKTLHLGSISLSSLDYLPPLSTLRDLYIPHNTISNVTKTPSLFPSLEFLDIQHNCLDNVQSLAPLRGLGELTELKIEGNPFCSLVDDYCQTQLKEMLPNIEVVDEVSLTGSATMVTRGIPLMRPLTPSSIGPSLRQVEQHIFESEVQLENFSSEIRAKFELLRADEGTTFPRQQKEYPSKRSRTRSGGQGRLKEALFYASQCN